MEQNKQPCPACERRAAMAKIDKDYIEQQAFEKAVKEGIQINEQLYCFRMEICSECSELISGTMCRQSGFYVASKAMYPDSRCPFPGKNKWNSTQVN